MQEPFKEVRPWLRNLSRFLVPELLLAAAASNKLKQALHLVPRQEQCLSVIILATNEFNRLLIKGLDISLGNDHY